MNINVILKYAFILAIGIYGVVAWFVCQQPLEPEAQQTEAVGLMLPILTGTYIMQILLEPFFTRRMMETQGEYNKNVMIVKLSLFESCNQDPARRLPSNWRDLWRGSRSSTSDQWPADTSPRQLGD